MVTATANENWSHLCASHCAKPITWVASFSAQNVMRRIELSDPFYRWENWSMEMFENLAKWESYFNLHNLIPKSEHLTTRMCMWSAMRNVSEDHCEVQLSVGWVVACGGYTCCSPKQHCVCPTPSWSQNLVTDVLHPGRGLTGWWNIAPKSAGWAETMEKEIKKMKVKPSEGFLEQMPPFPAER